MTRQPNAVASAPTARPIEPSPTIPTVTSRSSRALERLPRPLALELEELGQPAADRQDHHQDVLGDRAREDAAGVRDDDAALPRRRRQGPLDAGRRRVDPGQLRRAGEQPIERLRRQPAAEQHLDVVDRPVGEALDATASRSARPGAAARIRSRSRDR